MRKRKISHVLHAPLGDNCPPDILHLDDPDSSIEYCALCEEESINVL